MQASGELQQITLLFEIDELAAGVRRWAQAGPAWRPAQTARALTLRVLDRVQTVRLRLESPLVVATFGGTGTGKSTLVNALVGQEVALAGRQRPTTKQPVLLVHPDFDLQATGLPVEQCLVRRIDAPILRDLVLLDCPDPDTSEDAEAGGNLQRLRSLLPYCDVLLVAATQQKYRSARIAEELGDAAAGCRLVFVQTHADQDVDIRDDWRRVLSEKFQVSDLFFVDSRKALSEQQQGLRPTGDFGRLQELLSRQLGSSRRLAVRRANLVDLLEEVLESGLAESQRLLPQVERLQEFLGEQREQLQRQMSEQLKRELLRSRGLWERRLLSAITDRWGFSPLALLLRVYNGLGGILASLTFLRARSSAQMALIGAVQGARWLQARVQEQSEESGLERVLTAGIADHQLQEARLQAAGYARVAGLEVPELQAGGELVVLRRQAAAMEGRFLADVRQSVEQLLGELTELLGGGGLRRFFEVLLLMYPLFITLRMGHNFFWSSFLAPLLGKATQAAPLLTIDFYIPATFFLLLWCGLVLWGFVQRLQRAVTAAAAGLAERLAECRVGEGLFPGAEALCRDVQEDVRQLRELREGTSAFRHRLADTTAFLGAQKR
ncbi:MAG: GTPase domain-containing protein [Planctomyces sp.]